MTVRLKNLHDAACRNIRSIGKYKPYDRQSERNDLIMKRLLTDLINEKIDYVLLKDTKRFYCLHRSSRKNVLVQFSVGWWKDGDPDFSYHTDINTFKDLKKEGFPSGIWKYGKAS